MPSLNAATIFQGENILNVFIPLPAVHLCLTAVKRFPHNGINHYRQTCDFTHSARYLHALIVPPGTLTFLCKRHGHNQVNIVKKSAFGKLHRRHAPHKLPHLRMPKVFHGIHNPA